MSTNSHQQNDQVITEYGIILVLVAVAVIGAFALFGTKIKALVLHETNITDVTTTTETSPAESSMNPAPIR